MKNKNATGKRVLLFTSLTCLLLLAACSESIAQPSGGSHTIAVEVKTVQEVLQPGRAILLDAHLADGTNRVVEANDVQFEIWKKDADKHERVQASRWLENTYRTRTSFPQSGTYYVSAHVKSEGTEHVTPPKELVVQDILPAKN